MLQQHATAFFLLVVPESLSELARMRLRKVGHLKINTTVGKNKTLLIHLTKFCKKISFEGLTTIASTNSEPQRCENATLGEGARLTRVPSFTHKLSRQRVCLPWIVFASCSAPHATSRRPPGRNGKCHSCTRTVPPV